jgi:transcriptional regulator with XRE-family HTH domain
MELNRLFIQNLKRWRKAIGISQKDLAEKCGTAHSYIRQLESGSGHPSFAFIGKIANALQIEPYQLFYDETAKSNKSARIKYMESVQKKLIESFSNEIQNAFDELKKYQ